MVELVAYNVVMGVTYALDCCTSHRQGENGAPINLLDDSGKNDKVGEDDSEHVVQVDDKIEEMVMDDTHNAEDIDAAQCDEDVYPLLSLKILKLVCECLIGMS